MICGKLLQFLISSNTARLHTSPEFVSFTRFPRLINILRLHLPYVEFDRRFKFKSPPATRAYVPPRARLAWTRNQTVRASLCPWAQPQAFRLCPNGVSSLVWPVSANHAVDVSRGSMHPSFVLKNRCYALMCADGVALRARWTLDGRPARAPCTASD